MALPLPVCLTKCDRRRTGVTIGDWRRRNATHNLMMKPNVKQHRKSNSWASLADSSTWIMDKDKRHRTHFSVGQAMALAAICSSTAAVLTAMVAVHFFSSADFYSDRLIASTSRSIISRTRVRPVTPGADLSPPREPSSSLDPSSHNSNSISGNGLPVETKFPMSILPTPKTEDEGSRPHIVWLMSFPNRYVKHAWELQFLLVLIRFVLLLQLRSVARLLPFI